MPERYDINGNPIFSPFELVLTPTLEPAIVTASPVTSRGKYVLAKKKLQAAKEEHKEIKRDIKQYLDENGIFRTDEQIQPFVDRVNNSESIIGSRQDFKKARDAYYSELGNPNGLLPQLYRYWSRHYGYKSKQDEGDFTFGPGADIIDLRSNVQRLTPTSTQSTALFNEFVESKYPSVLSAETYKNSPNRIIGDMSKFPAKNVSIFGGIEDGKFRLDSLKNFDNSTTVIPARNIKSGTPMISSIQIGQEDQPGQSQVYRDWDKIDELWDLRENSLANEGNLLREYWSDPNVQEGIAEEINNLSEGNKYLRGMLESGNNSGPQHRRYIRQGIRHNKQDIKRWNKILMGKMPHYFLFDIMAANHTVAPRYPRPMSEIQTAQYFRDAEPAKYTFTDTNGEQHYVSEYNASVLDGKTVIGNPDGSIFIGKLQDISRPQLDSLNAYLKDNPSWIMRTDLGSFDQYRLDNPSLDTYLKQYYEHPKANDPNVYAVGTTEPNKLWNKALGGLLDRLNKHYNGDRAKIVQAMQYARGGFKRDDVSKFGHKFFDIVRLRYLAAKQALENNGTFTKEEIDRLVPIMVLQNATEADWRLDVPGNNIGGMMTTNADGSQTRKKYDSLGDYYLEWLDMMDTKFGDERFGSGKGWRSAKDADDYARIINLEDQDVTTKAKWNAYKKTHPNSYLYAPQWDNGDKTYSQKMAERKARTDAYLKMVMAELGDTTTTGAIINSGLVDVLPISGKKTVTAEPVAPQAPAPQQSSQPLGLFRSLIPTSVQQKMPATQSVPVQQQAPLLRSLIPTSVQKKMNRRTGGGLIERYGIDKVRAAMQKVKR